MVLDFYEVEYCIANGTCGALFLCHKYTCFFVILKKIYIIDRCILHKLNFCSKYTYFFETFENLIGV